MELAELLDVLTVQPVAGAPATFVGRSPSGRTRTIFGGQFLAQALIAAGMTVEDGRAPHSLHAYFVRAGDPATPIRYVVESVRDGRSFSHRQVIATQDGKEVFRELACFQVPRSGPAHDTPASGADNDDNYDVGVVDPAQLIDYQEWAATGTDNPEHDAYTTDSPCEIRYQGPPPAGPGQVVRGDQRLWARITGTVPTDDPTVHAALLAWLSDKTIADFATLAHGIRWTDQGADSVSLDHAMWFLRPARADEWLRFGQGSPSSFGGRAFTQGEFVTQAGHRVATVAQEVLLTLPV